MQCFSVYYLINKQRKDSVQRNNPITVWKAQSSKAQQDSMMSFEI